MKDHLEWAVNKPKHTFRNICIGLVAIAVILGISWHVGNFLYILDTVGTK